MDEWQSRIPLGERGPQRQTSFPTRRPVQRRSRTACWRAEWLNCHAFHIGMVETSCTESPPRFRSGPSSNYHRDRRFYGVVPIGSVLGTGISGLAAASRRSYGSLHIEGLLCSRDLDLGLALFGAEAFCMGLSDIDQICMAGRKVCRKCYFLFLVEGRRI